MLVDEFRLRFQASDLDLPTTLCNAPATYFKAPYRLDLYINIQK